MTKEQLNGKILNNAQELKRLKSELQRLQQEKMEAVADFDHRMNKNVTRQVELQGKAQAYQELIKELEKVETPPHLPPEGEGTATKPNGLAEEQPAIGGI